MIKDTGANLSWQIFSDATLKDYAINIHVVGSLSPKHQSIGNDAECGPETYRSHDRKVKDDNPMNISGAVSKPELIHGGPTDLEEIPDIQKISGTMIMKLTITSSGQVKDVELLRSIPGIEQQVSDAVRQWQYKPAIFNGKAVSVYFIEALDIRKGIVSRLGPQSK